jgi:hypothetical protein
MSHFFSLRKLHFQLIVAGSLLIPSLVSATSIQVPSMGIKTISEAMLRSRVGDTIWLEKGVYK